MLKMGNLFSPKDKVRDCVSLPVKLLVKAKGAERLPSANKASKCSWFMLRTP